MQEQAQSKGKDFGRNWLWVFLAVIVLAQFYFVRELLAAFAIFALVFLALSAVIGTLYAMQKGCELAFVRLAALRQPVLTKVTNMASVTNMGTVTGEHRKAA